MRREGSALNGVGVVVLKELSDHLTSVLMRVCEVDRLWACGHWAGLRAISAFGGSP